MNSFGMLVPNRFESVEDYRYGFNGKEKDDEVKGKGNSIDFGERLYDARAGRWWSTDNYLKPWISSYQFASDNPINNIDPDGNDEIHFYYRTEQTLDSEGKAHIVLTLSTEIIKNDQEHTFFMHSPTGATTQFHPFQNNRLPNQGSTAASDNQLPMSQGISWFYGLFEKPLDDYAYLGRLLKAAPEVMDHYSNAREDAMRFKGAVNMAGSVEFTETLITATETTYAIVDGYYLVKGLSKFAVKELAKNSLKIAEPSLVRITGEVGKLTKNKNANDAVGNFVLYEVFDKRTKEILKVGIANADNLMADGTIRRAHTSARLARNEGYANATFRIVEDMGETTKQIAKQKEASRVVKYRESGKKLPLNKETSKAYQPN
jgi:RHS repeat-associated protein